MRSECLPLAQIPHTTQLFSDFVSAYPKVQQFYSRPPYIRQWIQDEAQKLHYDDARRKRVSATLRRQNEFWGASQQTLGNIDQLAAGAAALVTGQQVGLFGGPAFAIYKALTAVKLAEEARRAGIDCVPVFWLATEDHDLEEVNQTFMPGADGVLQKLSVPVQSIADAPVGSITFGPEIASVVEQATQAMGDSEIVSALRESYRAGETFGSAFARLFAKVFAELGVVFLDASDPELHQVAAPIYRATIEHAGELGEDLLARGKELEAAGYHQQVKVTSASTLVFVLQNGARIPVHRDGTGFVIGEEKVSEDDLLARAESKPESFSANVLLRPVVQDYLLPTLAYTGGTAEVAYFAQAAVVYKKLLGRVTPIVPRFSATLVEPKPRSLLERYGINVVDVFQGPEQVREQLAARALPGELRSGFDATETSLKKSLAGIRSALERLDKTLVDAAENTESKMLYQLESLRAKAARAELRQTEVLGKHAQLLSNSLYPNKALQEREIAGVYFLSKYGKELLKNVYETMRADCLDHQVITV